MGGRTVPQIEREEKRKKEKRKRREKKRTSGPGNRILVLLFLRNGYSLYDTASAETGMRVSAGLLAVIQSDGVVVVIDNGVFIHSQLVDGRKVFFLGLKVGL